ncbi:hypothetical protein EU527_04310 [Candidatus Thorarchaeota archaeon]|nr:MAG: hypothetical protein EU527_04310 [Candidatus Thorarchaeota archaeon]
MHASKIKLMTLWVLILLVMPFASMPLANAWEAGDEEALFGHTFDDEYWTNDDIVIENDNGTASFTASYVHVDEFQAFLIAFNNANMSTGQKLILPYQLFGMHYKTPEDREVFIGAIFAFLLCHNESYGSNNLPDMGHDTAWYVVPFSEDTTFGVEPSVVPIPATKISDGHYRFGMSYYNLTCRIVDANSPFWFWFTLGVPIMRVLLSELTIEYDIVIHEDGTVQAESLYTIGQVHEMEFLGAPVEPSDIIIDSMKISAVHYLSIFTSQFRVTRASNGNTITAPTSTMPMDDNISIVVGASERAFDIGLGRQYSLFNETTDPWDVVSEDETAINCLLGARLSDLILVAWQLPLSAFIFAHMAYGLSESIRETYSSVGDMAQGALNGTAFVNSDWWYAVTFPEWNGLRVQQDPVYVAYTNLGSTMVTDGDAGGLVALLLIVVGIIAVIWLIRRRS